MIAHSVFGMNRSALEVQRDILTALAAEPVGITRVIYSARINDEMAHRYLGSMSERGLVQEIAGRTKARSLYRITDKGKDYLGAYEKLAEYMVIPVRKREAGISK